MGTCLNHNLMNDQAHVSLTNDILRGVSEIVMIVGVILYCMCHGIVLVQCPDTVSLYCALVLCPYICSILVLCPYTVSWYCVLVLCSYTVFWYCVLVHYRMWYYDLILSLVSEIDSARRSTWRVTV